MFEMSGLGDLVSIISAILIIRICFGFRCSAFEFSRSYSVRNASIGFTRVARSAGTKQDAAATIVSNPATAV